jgi:hypothetical protein
VNGYNLSRIWFDFAFSNPELIKPNHCALYFFAIEHCNRLGWKQKFGLPSAMAMEAIGIKSYHTYKATLLDLIDWGFIEMVEISKNQYSSNIIALANFDTANDKANDKALDKALSKHSTKQMSKHISKHSQSTYQSIDSINKQLNKEQLNKEPLNNTQKAKAENPTGFSEVLHEDVFYQHRNQIAEDFLKSKNPEVNLPATTEIVESTNQTTLWPSFEDFWQTYDKKRGDRDKIQKKWEKLKQAEKEAAMAYIPEYIKSQPDKQFRKDPATFLNNKSWNDEIITRNNPQSIQQPSGTAGSVSRIYQKLVASRGTG